MRGFLKTHHNIIQMVVSLLIVTITVMEMIGQPARLVHILTLTAATLSTGISIGVLIEQKRQAKREKLDAGKSQT